MLANFTLERSTTIPVSGLHAFHRNRNAPCSTSSSSSSSSAENVKGGLPVPGGDSITIDEAFGSEGIAEGAALGWAHPAEAAMSTAHTPHRRPADEMHAETAAHVSLCIDTIYAESTISSTRRGPDTPFAAWPMSARSLPEARRGPATCPVVGRRAS